MAHTADSLKSLTDLQLFDLTNGADDKTRALLKAEFDSRMKAKDAVIAASKESVIIHWDGTTLRRITVEKAVKIADEYRRRVLLAWEPPTEPPRRWWK